jgi:outer membrane protein
MHFRNWRQWRLLKSRPISKTRLAFKRAVCVFVGAHLLVSASLAASANITPQQLAAYNAATESQRIHILIRLTKTGQPKIAADLLKQFPLRGALAENRTLFVNGLVKEGQGNFKGAAHDFRKALANDPKLTMVRAELADVLVKLNENDSAKHHLRLLEADAPDPQTARGIKSFIDRIDDSSPFTYGGYFSIAPSTNINNGSSHTTVYSPPLDINLTIANQKQSGLGLSGGFNAAYSQRIGQKLQAVISAGVEGNAYLDPNFDSISTSESAEMRYLIDGGFISLGGVASQSYEPMKLDLSFKSYGPRIATVYQLTQRDLINANATYEWRDYGPGVAQNGTALSTNLAITHALDSSMNITVFGGYNRVNGMNGSVSYNTYFSGLNFYKELPMGVTLDASAQVHFSAFDDVSALFPTILRNDQRYVGSLTLTKRDLNILGFAPSIAYSYTLNNSNNPVYDFDAHAVDFRFTKEF